MVTILPVKSFTHGQIDSIEDISIPRGAASRALNWQTKGDLIELRRGQAYLGTASVNSGAGKATGLKKVTQATGIELLFGTYGKKLKYYDTATEEWIENGTDRLGSAVVDSNGLGLEPITMTEYVGLAGNQLFVNSPNCTGYFKIMVGNPGSALNVYNTAKNFKGHIKVDTNRTLLWGRTADQTGLYGSYIDTQTYTTVSAEVIADTAAGTLAFVSGTRTCFAITITDTSSGEVFTDNYDGTLTGSLGGTGTINYITGAFTTSQSGAGTADYQWEDSNANGVTDFTKSATRTAGQGFIFRQDEGGGAIKAVNQYNQVYYCMHIKKTWVLNITSTDTNATNLPYREKVGIPNERASVETGDGIYYIDDTDQNDVKVRLLTYDVNGSAQVIPVAVSNNLNLNDYRFDEAAAIEWGDLVLFACATNDSTQTIDGATVALNNRTLVYNKLWKAWDILDYAVTCFEVYNGTLVGGDALSNNFITLFSGFDDFDTDGIPNYWEGKLDDLDIEGLKKTKKLYVTGLIAVDQKIKVSVAIDKGPFVEVGGSDDGSGNHTYAIEGNGTYVDSGQSVSIGAVTLGSKEIGGGGNGATASPFGRYFSLNQDKFETIKVRFEAMANGYAAISNHTFWDIRRKAQKPPAKYRA